ncbi:aminoglycoside phosphotransferase family protein [Paenibacillus hamazuiensis]|uniref:aminoglycoside phosphotransferase family protein n=1 Tax=Paenibacillus hamazuiensis TaxID=2936508 RepID=UPI00200CE023|nr:aminoglycoside phosphotransferase family protein [Paenibacillus hamazuiensis]
MNPISGIRWKEKSRVVDVLLSSSDSIEAIPLAPGLEAEVTRIRLKGADYVLKVWNRSSKPSIENQYKLLQALFDRGLSVSEPLGWGLDNNNNQVLLTSFDGEPVRKVNKSLFAQIAKILTGIHKFPLEDLDESIVRKYDFVTYFYPRVEEHKDIHPLLLQLVKQSQMKQDKLIHGDFNLGNILETAGRYTVIDWTNGQMGDPRYDLAWSIVLITVFVSERNGSIYRSALLAATRYEADELELFEAMACLRWVLLHRMFNLIKGKETAARVRNMLKKNIYLNESFLGL